MPRHTDALILHVFQHLDNSLSFFLLDELLCTTTLSDSLLSLLLQLLIDQVNACTSSKALCDFLQFIYSIQASLQQQQDVTSHPLYRSLQLRGCLHDPSHPDITQRTSDALLHPSVHDDFSIIAYSFCYYYPTPNPPPELESVWDQLLSCCRRISIRSADDLNQKTQAYCGLNNPGCVCYLLSVMQQFFMIPLFRQGILLVPIFFSPQL